jgi:hypothetical protein
MVWLQFIVSHHPVIRSMRLSATQCPLPPSKSRSLWGQHHLVGKFARNSLENPQSQGFSPGVFARISRISRDPKFDFKMLQVGLKLSSGDFDQSKFVKPN